MRVPTGALVCISIVDVPARYELTPCVVTVAVPASKPVDGVVLKLIVDASSVRSPPVSKLKVKSPDAVAATVMLHLVQHQVLCKYPQTRWH